MKALNLLAGLALVFLFASSGLADCGKSHGKADPHNMGRIANTGFADLDADQSGGVTFEEFKSVFSRTSQSGFNMLDRDGSGELDKAEWQAFKDAHKGMGKYKEAPRTT